MNCSDRYSSTVMSDAISHVRQALMAFAHSSGPPARSAAGRAGIQSASSAPSGSARATPAARAGLVVPATRAQDERPERDPAP